MTHGRWSIMKLDAGQWTRPAPWPIHNNPINMAATPLISKADFTMALPMANLWTVSVAVER
jgi:hypothetical protein